MSKFNTPATNKTTNRSGFEAYAMDRKERLVTAVLTTMFGEPKFYGSTDNDIVADAQILVQEDPEFIAKLAAYTRNEGNLRSVSHVLTAVLARHGGIWVRPCLQRVIVRPDDMLEIMACFKGMYGNHFPNAMKRGIADAMLRFGEHAFAKYNGGSRDFHFRDVLRITHPVPQNEQQSELFRKILDDTLETPITWETQLSARGNTKEVWDELIAENKLGYMAMLRNLRNIAKSGADMAPVLKKLSDPDEIRKSRQLPFRFYSAYHEMKQAGLMTKDLEIALEIALRVSCRQMLKGRNLIAMDTSGSMGRTISSKSTIRCRDIAALFGLMAAEMCEDADTIYFDCASSFSSWRRVPGYKGYRVEHAKHADSTNLILRGVDGLDFGGGGTDMSLPMQYALHEDPNRKTAPYDRIIFLSDNECNYARQRLQEMVDEYRARYNKDLWVHAVDLQGYGTQQFCGERFNLIAGWSDSVLSFIPMAEAGIGSLVQTIEDYQL